MAISWQLKANRDRNKPMTKMNADQLRAALAAHDRIQAISDEIRARHGLQPVPENTIRQAARARLAMLEAKAAAKPTRAKAGPTLTAEQRLEAIAARRRKLARDRAECDQELAELARSRAVGVTRIAERVGVTRQAIYQLAGATA